MIVKRRAVDYAVWDDERRFAGRVRQLPNGWQAFARSSSGELLFAGWGRTLHEAVELL